MEKEISAHRQLVDFFSDTALATRGFRPQITAKDTQNLKRVLSLGILDQSQLEQIFLYFLADRSYRNAGPSIATILSATFLNSLRNKTINRAQFYKELDGYAAQYIKRAPKKYTDGPVAIGDLIGQLAAKLSLNKANPPRAPVVPRGGGGGES